MRNEFDNYNTLKLENRVLSVPEINGSSTEYLVHRAKSIVKAAAKKLKNIQISISERNALMAIAVAGLAAINTVASNEAKIATGKLKQTEIDINKKASMATIADFFLNDYPQAIADGSHKNLSSVSYFDYTIDPKDAVTIQRQAIDDNIKASSSFAMDISQREYGMSGFGAALPLPTGNFFTDNKEKIFIGVGALALGALGYHVFRTAKLGK